MHEKDPFGDKLREKERAEEDLYFSRRDKELLEKLRGKDDATREAAVRELSIGRCPKCGNRLSAHVIDDISLAQCDSCRGIWLNRDELASLSRRESESWLGRFFRHTLVHTR